MFHFMLLRVYVDNFRCLENFDLQLGREQLMLGRNGAGKSAFFDLLWRITRLASGEEKTDDLFPETTITRWRYRALQTFELDFKGPDGVYRYRLQMKHDDRGFSRIEQERVSLGTAPLFERSGSEAQLYRDNGSQGPKVLVDWFRSSLPALHERADNKKLTWLKRRLSRLLISRPDPRGMSSRSEKESISPELDLSNFASWYRHLLQERSGQMHEMLEHLKETLDGFQAMNLISEGQQRVLRTTWSAAATERGFVEYGFEELSDGQRALIALSALVFSLGADDATLCLDEPDNFVALPEIEPLLWLLRERLNIQVLVISHHPELIDELARTSGLVFERAADSPVRVRQFNAPEDTLLTASQLVARGDE